MYVCEPIWKGVRLGSIGMGDSKSRGWSNIFSGWLGVIWGLEGVDENYLCR